MISIGDYSFYEKEIRKTKLGQVYSCTNNRNQQSYFIEKILKEKIREEHKKILDIIKNSSQKNSNILKIYDVLQKDVFIYIITEQYDYTLQEYIDIRNKNEEQFKAIEIQEFIYQIVDGYLYLINHQIIHGDLNFQTIVVKQNKNENLFKLAQLNYSILQTSKLRSLNMPLIFQAPELLEDQKACQTEKSDIFSFGLIILQLCQQKYIKSIDSIYQLKQYQQNLKEKKNLHDNMILFEELQFIIDNTIQYKPEDRYDWINLKRKLNSSININDTSQDEDDIYEIDKQIISRGSQGCIFYAKNIKTNQQFVAKQLFGDDSEIQREQQLFQILRKNKHENIVQFVGKVKKNLITYLIIEKCDISLQDYKIQINTDEKIKDFMQQITKAFLFLKEQQIIHRDLKPQNIMIKYRNYKPIYKIIDFGVGKELSQQQFTNTKTGTPVYMAPEVYFQQQHNQQCDLFSLGLILYEIVYKQRLIQTNVNQQKDIDNFFHQIKNERFRCPFYHNPNLQDLIEKMIVYDQYERIQWDNVLNHPYFQPLEIQELLFQMFQLAQYILIYIQNNFKQLEQQMIIQLKIIILSFCQSILVNIFEICTKGQVSIEHKILTLQKNVSDSKQWLDDIKFFQQVQSINDILQQLNENEQKQIYQEKSIIRLHNEFKEQYLKNQDFLQSLFYNFEIQNSIEKFLNIFEDSPLTQLVVSIIQIDEQ